MVNVNCRIKEPGETAYLAAASVTECTQPWADANKAKWAAAEAACREKFVKELMSFATVQMYLSIRDSNGGPDTSEWHKIVNFIKRFKDMK